MRQEPVRTPTLPLDHLASTLSRLACPPHLGALVELMEGVEDYFDFLSLVREFLPEREAEILDEPNPDWQVTGFAQRFRERYFPLAISEIPDDLSYAHILSNIPVALGGITWDDLHSPDDLREGVRLMIALVSFENIVDANALRTVWLEACVDDVNIEDLARIPPEGYSQQRLHALLDGTRFEPLAMIAEMVVSSTGTYYLDLEYDTEIMFEWGRDTVTTLTQEWLRADMMLNRVNELADWLVGAPRPRFRETLDFIEHQGGIYGDS